MSAAILATLAVRVENCLIDPGRRGLQPRQEGGTEIETDERIIVDDGGDAVVAIENPRCRIRGITLRSYSFVPIVIRVSRILQFNRLEPRVFARRLIEVSVDADVSHDRSA